MKELCQKWKVIFQGAWNSLMAWVDRPWPLILRQIYQTYATGPSGDIGRETTDAVTVGILWNRVYSESQNDWHMHGYEKFDDIDKMLTSNMKFKNVFLLKDKNVKNPFYGRTLSDASMLYFADVFKYFFMPALVGQTAERIFTKLSHVVDIRCYLRTY